MAIRPQIRITREGYAYLLVMGAVLFGANFRQLNLLMLVGCLLAGPFVFSLCYGWLALRRLKIARTLPAELQAGQRLLVDINVTNCRRWVSIWMIHVQDTARRIKADGVPDKPVDVDVYIPQIPASESRAVSYQGRLFERGPYEFGPLRVSTRFPLGLVRHTVELNQPDNMLVLPGSGRLTHDWAAFELRENDRGERPLERRGTLEGDFFGLRDWRTGDSRRWIHWRTSARRGTLVVRQFEQRRSQDLALLVDLWLPVNPSAAQLENVEVAIRLVNTIIADACRRAGRSLLLTVAAETPVGRLGAASPNFLREQMTALALVVPHHESRIPSLLADSLVGVAPATPTLLISTREVDAAAFWQTASQPNSQRVQRTVQTIHVGGRELAKYYAELTE